MTVAKTWTFTKNNYDSNDIQFFIEWSDFTYMVFGRETAPTTGTPHIQGYFTLSKAVRPSYLKRVLPKGTHFEAARKCELANTRYCTKSGNYTVIDRRRGRPGTAAPVTVQPLSPQSPSSPSAPTSDLVVESLVTKLLPKMNFQPFFPRS